MKKALITGITGQDGSYLAEQLLARGYDVHGIVRRSSRGYDALANISHLVQNEAIYRKRLHLHSGDMGDASSLNRIMMDVRPDEIFSLAAQADVQESFFMPEYSLDINGTGVVRLLEAMRKWVPNARFYQASTSELFGATTQVPQNENTPFNPQSPYSIGKLAGFHAVKKYREMYGMFCVNGILFNHASPRRTDDYLDRKVTKAVARIKTGKQKTVRLGNLDSYRDWGASDEYVYGAWLMLQQDKPEDFVLGTGETHSVKEFVERAFARAGLDWKKHVIIDPKLFRPAEVDILKADYSKAKEKLGWEPKKKFAELVDWMVDEDIRKEEQSV